MLNKRLLNDNEVYHISDPFSSVMESGNVARAGNNLQGALNLSVIDKALCEMLNWMSKCGGQSSETASNALALTVTLLCNPLPQNTGWAQGRWLLSQVNGMSLLRLA